MKTFFKWLGILIVVVIIGILVFFTVMRFHDGPSGLISGGPFKTGDQATVPTSWGFLKDVDTIEFQTLEPDTSRTVWLGVHDERLFIISGYMKTRYGKLWKQWPHYLNDDDRIILRHDSKLYALRLERQIQGDHLLAVLTEFGRKYGFSGATTDVVTNEDVWLFEALPRVE